MTPTFEILLHDTVVATLHAEGEHEARTWVTDWDAAWVAASPRSIVSLKLLDINLHRARTWGTRLPPFLTNLLPEADSALRRRLARTHGLVEDDDVAFLTLLGNDLSGAVRVRSVDARPAPPQRKPVPADAPLLGYRASLGGMQLKFSAHRQERITLPAHGELSEWILKLPPAELPRLPTWEAAALSWARAVGFDVPEHDVEATTRVDGLPEDVLRSAPTCLIVRRFDRPGGNQRVHMEEACSFLGLHPESKYAEGNRSYNLARVGRMVLQFAGEADATTFVERIVFDALVGNGDAHLKNWALVFPDGHAARLAPVYDVVPTAMIAADLDLALPLHGSQAPRFEHVHPHAVQDLAMRVKLNPQTVVARAHEIVHQACATFDAAIAPWQLTDDERKRWKTHIDRVAQAWR